MIEITKTIVLYSFALCLNTAVTNISKFKQPLIR